METHRYCLRCDQTPELISTGKGAGQAQWYCNVCKAEYYDEEDVRFDWENIGTELVEKYPNKLLLELSKNCEVLSGYGLLAEVCKRLSKIKEQENG